MSNYDNLIPPWMIVILTMVWVTLGFIAEHKWKFFIGFIVFLIAIISGIVYLVA